MDIRPLIDFTKVKKKKFIKALEVEPEKIINNITVSLQPQDEKESLQYITASEEDLRSGSLVRVDAIEGGILLVSPLNR